MNTGTKYFPDSKHSLKCPKFCDKNDSETLTRLDTNKLAKALDLVTSEKEASKLGKLVT